MTQKNAKNNSPRDHHHKVHDIPHVPEVAVLVQDEAHGDDLGAHLHGEDPHEDWLQLLQLQGQDGLVVVGNPGVHGHDNTVSHDGDDDQPFEGWPCHEPNKQSPANKSCLNITWMIISPMT